LKIVSLEAHPKKLGEGIEELDIGQVLQKQDENLKL